MSRQLDLEKEKRDTLRRTALVKALDFGIVGALESQGIELQGFAFKFDAFNCLMTIKAVIGGDHQVCFIGSDSMMNCILKAQVEASNNTLRWRPDKFKSS